MEKKSYFTLLITILCLECSWVLAKFDESALREQIKEVKLQLKETPGNVKLLVELGRLYHEIARGCKGRKAKQAIKSGLKYLDEALSQTQDDPLAMAWYGSLLTLQGREAWFPLTKARYVNQGIKMLDKAVKLAPRGEIEIWTRMIRANNSLALPSFFNRIPVAISDFEALLKLSREEPLLFSKELLIKIYLGLGKAYKENEELDKAKEAWKRILRLAPASQEAEEARKLLEEY
jgi:tetratricopeptide (TPR) repeat protein